jgi:hypothetical protein
MDIVLQALSDLLMNKMAGIYKGWASWLPSCKLNDTVSLRLILEPK